MPPPSSMTAAYQWAGGILVPSPLHVPFRGRNKNTERDQVRLWGLWLEGRVLLLAGQDP